MKRRSFLRAIGGAALTGLGAQPLGAQRLSGPLSAPSELQIEPVDFKADRLTIGPNPNSGQRIVVDRQGVRVYDAQGVLRVSVG
jgi:hypothetical protein